MLIISHYTGYINDEWSVKHNWNYELVSKPMIIIVLINYCVHFFTEDNGEDDI